STIPIVFIAGADPVQQGLGTSLNRPVGNVTGVSYIDDSLIPKRLEFLHELVPNPAAIAVLLDANLPDPQLARIETAARVLGRDILIVKAGTEAEFDPAFAKIVQADARALFVGT